MVEGGKGNLVGVVFKLRGFLGHFEVEYLALFICFNQVITPMEFIANKGGAILGSKAIWVTFFGLFGVHGSNGFFPFGDGVAFRALAVDEDHDAALATHHVLEDIFEVGFILMFVE